MLRAVICGAAIGAMFAGPAGAQFFIPGLTIQTTMTPAQKRSQVRPYVLALTNCVANRTLQDVAGAEALKNGTFDTFVPSIIDRCPRALEQLSQAYDQLFGQGQGEVFINGPYAKDLPRAVLARVRPQLEAKVDEMKRAEAEQAQREAQAKADEEERARQAEVVRQRSEAEQAERDARAKAEAEASDRQAEADRQRAAAEAEQQAATARAEADRAKATERAAAQVAEAERLKQVAAAEGAAKLLAVKALDCGREQLRSLVKSGESAEILAAAVMTMCSSDVDHFVEASAREYALEHQVSDEDTAAALIREKLKADTREHIVALAVQAKAGVGGFAPASSN